MEECDPTLFGVFPVLTYCAPPNGYVLQLYIPALAHWVFYGREKKPRPAHRSV